LPLGKCDARWKEEGLVEGNDGESLIVGVGGGAVRIRLLANVCLIILLVEFILFNFLPFLLLVLVIIAIKTICYKTARLTVLKVGMATGTNSPGFAIPKPYP
jgi:hypothetical protein